MRIAGRRVLKSEGWKENCTLVIDNGRIINTEPGLNADEVYDILSLGLFDIHVHGGMGYNTENCDIDALQRFLLWEAEHGVTDVLLTVSTTSLSLYQDCIPFIRNAIKMQSQRKLMGAIIRGIHLEGPFLSLNRLGAMLEKQIMQANVENLLKITCGKLDDIRLVSLAPEVSGAKEVTRYLVEHGVCVSAGHTDATYEEADEGFSWGIDALCHSFNACRPIHHRDPGVVIAALTEPSIYCETICDLNHLHPAIIRLVWQCKGHEKMCIISDSICTTGLPYGTYFTKLGKEIRVQNGCMRTSSGALDGGICTIGESVRNLKLCGISEYDALFAASYAPASRLKTHVSDVNLSGSTAHIAAWNDKLELQKSIIGQKCY